jgi:RNA polymerase sigma-70 factor (ECF subfamily)
MRPGKGDIMSGTMSAVMAERRRLINLAYRMLGSLAEAEDAVQETYARWYAMSAAQQEAIESPGAWLTTVASRICLDLLRRTGSPWMSRSAWRSSSCSNR